ncbi:MAG: AraC family transcriptional regulator [Bacteroidales bacterium]|nr:AraC family transcriptional regulator [Bacteroidales bacterium]
MAENLIIRHTIDSLGDAAISLYLTHILCLEGSATITFNARAFAIEKGGCCIIRATQLIEGWKASDDFRCVIVYADPQFIEKATPRSNYGIRGSLSLFNTPVFHLDEEEFERCKEDYEHIEKCLANPDHRFFEEVKLNAMQTLILDLFDFHARQNGQEDDIQTSSARLMRRFIGMLERGDYRQNREVSYYASELCVAPKYLSEICKQVSGESANYWINRFTILDISRLLRDKQLDFVEITDLFNFSSASYFSRYVQRYLGETPSDYRG